MFSKIVLTAVIIVLVYLVLRSRTRVATRAEAETVPPVVSPRLVAYVFLGVAAVSGGVIYWLEWQDDRQVITIRVINSRTGDAVIYQAEKGKIRGRRFETLDGREVTIADVDRVEMLEQ